MLTLADLLIRILCKRYVYYIKHLLTQNRKYVLMFILINSKFLFLPLLYYYRDSRQPTSFRFLMQVNIWSDSSRIYFVRWILEYCRLHCFSRTLGASRINHRSNHDPRNRHSCLEKLENPDSRHLAGKPKSGLWNR